jgi:hypothetical protein
MSSWMTISRENLDCSLYKTFAYRCGAKLAQCSLRNADGDRRKLEQIHGELKQGCMRMKIVYLVHQFYPECYTGTEKFVLNLSGMVQKAGNRVKVITYSFYEDSFYDQRRGEILCKDFLYKGIPYWPSNTNSFPMTSITQ